MSSAGDTAHGRVLHWDDGVQWAAAAARAGNRE